MGGMTNPDPKYRVTMRSAQLDPQSGEPVTHEAVDYVPTSILPAYVADARTKWQHVAVSDEIDYGPAGEDGDTHYPDHLTPTEG